MNSIFIELMFQYFISNPDRRFKVQFYHTKDRITCQLYPKQTNRLKIQSFRTSLVGKLAANLSLYTLTLQLSRPLLPHLQIARDRGGSPHPHLPIHTHVPKVHPLWVSVDYNFEESVQQANIGRCLHEFLLRRYYYSILRQISYQRLKFKSHV